MTQRPGDLPPDVRAELERASKIPDRRQRLAAIDKARERAAHNYPQLFKENTHMTVKLKNVRLAFPNIFTAKAFSGDVGSKADFNASFILAKDHPQFGEVVAAIKAAAVAKWGEKKGADMFEKLKKQDKLALHDGDTKSQYAGFEDNFYISARNKTKPLVVGRKREPLSEADGVVYAGCYVNVILDFWAQDNSYGQRVNASLGGVQFYADGDAFTGGGAADADDFDDIGDLGEGETADAGGSAW